MPTRHTTEQPLSPELEAIAAAAADHLRAHTSDDVTGVHECGQRVADAASAAIQAGAALSAIAEAKRLGQERAAPSCAPTCCASSSAPPNASAKPTPTTRTRSTAPPGSDCSHRHIVTAAAVSHGTILARVDTQAAETPPAAVEHGDGEAGEEGCR